MAHNEGFPMGLDMYLEGRMYQWTNWKHPETDERRHGKRVKEVTVELGYWRKHPDLHGFIVNAFADGKDECQDIELSKDDVEKIIEAIETDNLAHGTDGFFFGRSYQPGEKDEYSSYDQQKQSDVATFREALAWFAEQDADKKWSRSIVYRASW
jgi:hypothetical protein